jgi:excisionase family DNA binding protein
MAEVLPNPARGAVELDQLPPWLLTGEAAGVLRVNIATVKRMIARGDLRATKVGRAYRIQRADVEALMAGAKPTLDEQIAEIVAGAPPLTDEQVDVIVGIVRADRA